MDRPLRATALAERGYRIVAVELAVARPAPG